MNYEELKTQIEQAFPGISVRVVRESLLLENPDDLPRIVTFFKHSSPWRMNYLSSITGADYLDYLESVYHFYSMETKSGPLVLRVRVKQESPRVPSLVPLFRSADLQERQAYDMFGIEYIGHPNLERLYLWEGFEGFPLRKDYKQEDSDTLDETDWKWLEKHNIQQKKPVTGNQKNK